MRLSLGSMSEKLKRLFIKCNNEFKRVRETSITITAFVNYKADYIPSALAFNPINNSNYFEKQVITKKSPFAWIFVS